MAKKRIEREPIEDNEPEDVQYESVEPEAVEDTYTFDEPPTDGLAVVENFAPQELITKPGGPAVVLDTDEATMRVSFALPRRVLMALVDSKHPESDTKSAIDLHLLSWERPDLDPEDTRLLGLTELGKLVLDGCDVIALRHKMLAGYRAAQNKAVDIDKTGFVKE